MEGIMAPERPSFSLELQYPHRHGHSSIWSEYGTYRSFLAAKERRLYPLQTQTRRMSSIDRLESIRSEWDRSNRRHNW